MISNQPKIKGKSIFPYVKIDSLFSIEEINNFIEYCETRKDCLEESTVFDGSRNANIRVSSNWFDVKNEKNYWFFDKINNAIDFVNNEFYGFDLWGYERFQYSEYSYTNHGKYDAHIDMFIGDSVGSSDKIQNAEMRKLSATVALNQQGTDYEGGDFFVGFDAKEKVHIPTGGMIVFPSFIVHGIEPVLSGVRKSAVIWVEGPKFK